MAQPQIGIAKGDLNSRFPVRPGLGRTTASRDASLPRLVADPTAFLQEGWGKRLVLTATNGDLLSEFSIDYVAQLLSSRGLRLPDVRMMRDGDNVEERYFTESAQLGRSSIGGLVDPDMVARQIASGSTLILQGARRYSPELDAFCRRLDMELDQVTQGGFFLTPAESQGAPLHYDFFDAFVYQLSGEKLWKFWDAPSQAPTMAWRPNEEPTVEPTIVRTLIPGDCVYMPRGTFHVGQTGRSPSLHLTVRVVQPYTYRSVLEAALQVLLSENSGELERPLTPGFVGNGGALLEQLDRYSNLQPFLRRGYELLVSNLESEREQGETARIQIERALDLPLFTRRSHVRRGEKFELMYSGLDASLQQALDPVSRGEEREVATLLGAAGNHPTFDELQGLVLANALDFT